VRLDYQQIEALEFLITEEDRHCTDTQLAFIPWDNCLVPSSQADVKGAKDKRAGRIHALFSRQRFGLGWQGLVTASAEKTQPGELVKLTKRLTRKWITGKWKRRHSFDGKANLQSARIMAISNFCGLEDQRKRDSGLYLRGIPSADLDSDHL